jgi:hypothetical protein
VAVAYSTAIHTLVVSQARYNLPLMPALIAGGVAGWFLFLRGRRPAATVGAAEEPPKPARAERAAPAAA